MRRDALVVAVLCACAGLALTVESRREDTLRRANDAGIRGDYVEAARLARKAAAGPTRARALHVEGLALLAGQDPQGASVVLREAAEASPHNWRVRVDWAIALLRVRDARGAEVQYARALSLNPSLVPPAGFADP